jgi:hypothetical protein
VAGCGASARNVNASDDERLVAYVLYDEGVGELAARFQNLAEVVVFAVEFSLCLRECLAGK